MVVPEEALAVVRGLKKRKVLWVGGSIVVAVALFAAIAFFIDYNSTDARVERAVAQIVEEYGFELKFQGPIDLGLPRGSPISKTYSRAPVSAEKASAIVAMLRSACPSCKYDHMVIDGDILPDNFSGPIETHNFRPQDQDGGLIAAIAFNPNNRGHGRPENEPEATFHVSKFDRPSLWLRIRGLWPW